MFEKKILRVTKCILSVVVFQAVLLLGNQAGAAFPHDFDGVVWLHTDVSSWVQTGTLSSVSTTASTITLDYNKANSWPGLTITSSSNGQISVNANPWIFVKQNNTWYAATFEWMRVGQTTKSKLSVNGDHIKRSPLDTFVPQKGEIYGFMVSGLARDSKRNVQERTNVVMYAWDVGMVPVCTGPPEVSYFLTPNVTLSRNEAATVSWKLEGADTASLSPYPGPIDPGEGSIEITLEETTTFTLKAANDCGTTSVQKTVEVYKVLLSPILILLND
jgi:hypothetical protein